MKIGICFSGGGARGAAHIGVLKALHERGLRPTVISGVSAGALVGAFYAAGYHPDEILRILVTSRVTGFLKLALHRMGFLSIETTAKFFKKYLPARFEDLRIPLVVNATEIQSGRMVFFERGELIRPLQASACIPVVFKPVRLDNELYVDGGVLNNLPVEPLQGRCDFIIGSHANPFGEHRQLKNFRQVLERTFNLTVAQNVSERRLQCDLLIEPAELAQYRVFELSKVEAIFQTGYRAAAQALDRLPLAAG